MCFSATASFSMAGILSLIGYQCLKSTKAKNLIPLAAIPFIFAMQQLMEGLVWRNYPDVYPYANLFMFFAHFWAFWIPFSLWKIEQLKWSRAILLVLMGVGSLFIMNGLWSLVLPVPTEIIGHSIAYTIPSPSNHIFDYALLISILYRLCVIGSCLVSSIPYIRIFGILLFLSERIAYWFWAKTFVSIWCFFAAILSMCVWYVVKNYRQK
jgi:hypothetical protein